ncbi:MAG: hypothetical protein H6Q90_4578 [Deltaproteobacteria bacterium]|nr:hypothetical protein [Deltaproteobacteria bacterium]
MALGKRPGGLTAMAVLNFVFGGIGAIFTLLAFGGLALIREGIKAAEASGEKYDGPSMTVAWVMVLMTGVAAFLLICSGVGYLKQKKVLGRSFGTLYALVSLSSTAIGIATAGAGLGAILFAIYPLLTLVLVNSSFKNDLTN